MAKLIYSTITSLDLYNADENGSFDWAAPDEEVHAYINDLERPIGTHLYGRRIYEVMAVWETMPMGEDQSPAVRDYATIWKDAQKIVYSRTLEAVSSARTRIEREFDPEAVRRLKEVEERDIGIGGPHLAAEAIRAGLVDEWNVFLTPILVGAGTKALPDGVRTGLDLVSQRRLSGGVVHLRYRTREVRRD